MVPIHPAGNVSHIGAPVLPPDEDKVSIFLNEQQVYALVGEALNAKGLHPSCVQISAKIATDSSGRPVGAPVFTLRVDIPQEDLGLMLSQVGQKGA